MSIYRDPGKERRGQQMVEARIANKREPAIRRALESSFKAAADANEKEESIDAAIKNSSDDIKKSIEHLYSDAYTNFYERTSEAIAQATGKAMRKDKDDRFERALRAFIRRWTARKITQITSATQAKVRKIIKDGQEEGLTLREIGKEIIDTGARQSAYRAHLIARTETHSASQAGSVEAAKQSDVVRQKIWLSAGDDRVRDDEYDHTNVEPVGINDKFVVSGEELDAPGDPSGSAGNIIMCRCIVDYEVRR